MSTTAIPILFWDSPESEPLSKDSLTQPDLQFILEALNEYRGTCIYQLNNNKRLTVAGQENLIEGRDRAREIMAKIDCSLSNDYSNEV